ncbi:MAG: hypothetical protein AABW93_01870 [Nanoarchaeota archaeon]
MGKITTFLYGALIVFAALDAMFLGFVPSNVLPIAVIILGVLVLFTPIVTRGIRGSIGAPFQWLRRWIFGAVMIIIGAASSGFIGSGFLERFNILGSFTLDTFVGQIVLLLIGIIYFLATFARTRQINAASY